MDGVRLASLVVVLKGVSWIARGYRRMVSNESTIPQCCAGRCPGTCAVRCQCSGARMAFAMGAAHLYMVTWVYTSVVVVRVA